MQGEFFRGPAVARERRRQARKPPHLQGYDSSVPHSGVTVWWSARLIWVRSPCDPSRKLSTSDSKRFGGTTMTAPHIIDPAGLLGEALSQASPDLMRSLLQHVINALLSADADTVCGAQWGQQDPQRHTQRNGYRYRPLDTRVGTIDVAIPKLRSGWPGLVLWTGCFEGCWLLLVVLCPLARVLVG